MKNLENEYKNRFNAQEMPVDKNESDELWAAVSTELDSLVERKKPRVYRMAVFLLLGLLIGTWGLYHAYRPGSAPSQSGAENSTAGVVGQKAAARPDFVLKNTQPPAAAPQLLEKQASIPTNSGGLYKNAPSNIAGAQNLSQKAQLNAARAQIPQRSSTVDVAERIKHGENMANAIPAPLTPDRTGQKENDVPSKLTAFEASLAAGALSNSTVSDPTNAENLPIQAFKPMELLPIQPMKTVLQNADRPILPLMAVPGNKREKEHRPLFEWQVAAEAGVNLTTFRFAATNSTDLAAQKNAVELPGLGNSTALRASLLWKQRWSFATGLEYQQCWSAFSFKQEETIQVLKTNQLLRALVNTANGDTLKKIIGDTLINATFARTVWHNNTFRQIGIPLELGIHKDMGKWFLGGGIGAVVVITTLQSGKALDDQAKIIAFEAGDAAAPYTKIGIGLRASPLLGYRMSRHWALTLRPQWTWQRNTGLLGTDLRMNAHVFNANLGLQYTIR